MKTTIEFFDKNNRIIKEEYNKEVSDFDIQLRATALNLGIKSISRS